MEADVTMRRNVFQVLASRLVNHGTDDDQPKIFHITQQGNMPLLRPQLASRLLQANAARHQQIAPRGARWASKMSSEEYADRSAQPAPKASPEDPPTARSSDSGMIRQEDPTEGLVDHQPDYHAPIDHGTS